MCVTIFGLTICVTTTRPQKQNTNWYPGLERQTAEIWREEAQYKALRFR